MGYQHQGNLEPEMDGLIYSNEHPHQKNDGEQEKNYANAFLAAAQNARSLQETEWLQLQLKESSPHHKLQLPLPPVGSEGTVPSSSASYAYKHRRQEGKKRGMEKITEGRQKRMIRNRESAARSRARRQAYTNELEIEITHLIEENAKLRMQLVSESLIPASHSQQTKNILRRTFTAPF